MDPPERPQSQDSRAPVLLQTASPAAVARLQWIGLLQHCALHAHRSTPSIQSGVTSWRDPVQTGLDYLSEDMYMTRPSPSLKRLSTLPLLASGRHRRLQRHSWLPAAKWRACVRPQRPWHTASGIAAWPQVVEALRVLRLASHCHFRVRWDARLACAGPGASQGRELHPAHHFGPQSNHMLPPCEIRQCCRGSHCALF